MEATATYEQVKEVCNRLKAEGSRITTRTIQNETGGSMTTVLKFKRQWEQEARHADQANLSLSSELQTAILAEIGRAVTAAREERGEELEAATQREEEALEALEAAEKRIEQLTVREWN